MTAAGPGAKPAQVFVVGCPRSGTTLVQAILAAHPAVFSFPETHYFRKIRGRLWRGRPTVLVSPRAAAASLDRLVADVGLASRPDVPRWWPFAGRYARAFAQVANDGCRSAGKRCWVEKSPIHLRCMDEIQRVMADAHFVHVVRDGRDVVASIFELCEKEPDRWVGQFLDGSRSGESGASPAPLLEAIMARWNGDIALTRRHLGESHHRVVRYDRLLADPRAEVRGLCQYLSLDFDESMLDHRRSAPDVLGWRSEFDHMQRIFDPIGPSESKFADRLSAVQQREVLSGLAGGGSLDEVLPSN